MQLIPDLFALLQPFSALMTGPTFSNLLRILTGWVLSRRHTVSAGLAADGPLERHFSSYYRVLSKARWCVDAAGLNMARLVLALSCVVPVARVRLIVDDTLCKKKGRLPFGVGMHYDASATGRGLSNSGKSYKANGHCWVILGLGVELKFRPGHIHCLPVLARLYHNHKSAKKHKVTHRTKVQLAVEMIGLMSEAFPGRRFHLLTDSAYAGKNLLTVLPANVRLTARWITNPALYAPVTPPPAGKKGRPRVHGDRLPGVEELVKKPGEKIEVDVYGKHQTLQAWRTFACFYTAPGVLLNIVVTRGFKADGRPDPGSLAVMFSTDTSLSPKQVVELYAERWGIEVMIHDAKQQLGIAQPQVWCRRSVERAVPVMLLMYTTVVAWFGTGGHHDWKPVTQPWYQGKTKPSFADMLGHLRIKLLDRQLEGVFKDRSNTPVVKKALARFTMLLKQAA